MTAVAAYAEVGINCDFPINETKRFCGAYLLASKAMYALIFIKGWGISFLGLFLIRTSF